MPFAFKPNSKANQPSHPLPNHLDHKPFFALPYQGFDGYFVNNPQGTDIRYISVGIAQYDPYEVSIKTMRHSGTKWSRQAEELPVHRVIDMTLFLSKALLDSNSGVIDVPAGTYDGQSSDIEITRESRSSGELESYRRYIEKNGDFLKERFNALHDVLVELKREGKL